MSFGGKGSSYQWEKGTTGRDVPRRLETVYDQLTRGLIGQMARPPETAVGVPLQQAISNLQSGEPGRAFGFGTSSSMADRLAGTPSTAGSGTAGAGFAPGSFAANAPGGQQGLQTREQLGLPARESYFTFMPSAEDIAQIGIAPVRSSIKNKDKLLGRIDRLQGRIAEREAQGKGAEKAKRRLERTKTRLDKQTGDLYYP
jgi:hypothetical protein